MTDSVKEQERSTLGKPVSEPERRMSKDMTLYYSNCAMVGTTHREISLLFGRLAPATAGRGNAPMVELYERQIYMTVEQAEDLAHILVQSIKKFKAQKQVTVKTRPPSPSTPRQGSSTAKSAAQAAPAPPSAAKKTEESAAG
jgi:hypothetical protein